MRKILVSVMVSIALFSPAFASYTLTESDNAIVTKALAKFESKTPAQKQKVADALKIAQVKYGQDERIKAILGALETTLRGQTVSNTQTNRLATAAEREQIKNALNYNGNNEAFEKATLGVNLSGHLTTNTEPKDLVFDTKLIMNIDVSNLSEPKVQMQLDGSGSMDEYKAALSFEGRVLNNMTYIKLAKLNLSGGDSDQIAPFIQQYIGKWFSSPTDEDTFSDVETAENTKIATTILQTNFIPELRYLGQTNGVTTFGGRIDNNAILETIKKISVEEGEPLAPADQSEIADILKHFTFDAAFSLDKNTFQSFKVKTIVKNFTSPEGDVVNGEVTAGFTLAPFTGTITAPEGAVSIDSISSL